MNFAGKAWLYFNTVRYLKASQVVNRLTRLLAAPFRKIDLSPPPAVRANVSLHANPIERSPGIMNVSELTFLNRQVEGDLVDIWNSDELPKLWLYQLHYFNDLSSVGSQDRRQLLQGVMLKWICENPPGHGAGWEPYPSCIRIVNVVKWLMAEPQPDISVVTSLAVQVRYLAANVEYHLGGNHLFSNAKALVFAGVFFCGPEARGWLRQGMAILIKEVREQIMEDGGHFERSPMYHALALEDMLDLKNLLMGDPELFSDYESHTKHWSYVIDKMLSWLQVMSHPDGNIAFFNDAAFGVAPTNIDLFSYAQSLGHVLTDNISNVTYLRDTGYVRVVNGPFTVLIDVADVGPDYIPAHAHADTLSYEFSLGDERVIVNSGTSQYERGELRDFQRGTSAHSTVEIDSEDSSQVWHGFRVANRARVYDVAIAAGVSTITVTAKHNGYSKLFKRRIHERTWTVSDDSLTVKDIIYGGFSQVVSRHYLHPRVKVSSLKDRSVFKLITSVGGVLHATLSDASLIVSQWYPEFGRSISNQCLVEKFESGESLNDFSVNFKLTEVSTSE